MIRVIVSNISVTSGGSPTSINVNFQDTTLGNTGNINVNVDFTKISNNDEIKQILARDIVAYINSTWSPTMGAGDSILFVGL